MTSKKGELSEMDIKKENADLSMNDLSDVSGGKKLFASDDDRYLNQKDKDGVFLNPKGEGDAMFKPEGEGASPMASGDEEKTKSQILPESPALS